MQFRWSASPRRRRMLQAAVAAGCGLVAAPTLRAQQRTGTHRPLTIVVPFPAGGGADMDARTLADALGRLLDRPVLVNNVSGGAGSIAAQKVALEPADGNTLLYLSVSEAVVTPLIMPAAMPRIGDLVPIALSGTSPIVYFTRPDHPVDGMEQLIARARQSPGRMTYGTGGASSYQFLATEILRDRTGAVLTHVPYRGGGGVLTDVIGGVLDFGVTIVAPVIGLETQHRIKILGVSSHARLAVLPGVPCFGEIGPLKDTSLQNWGMFFAHRGTPDATKVALNEAIATVANQPAISELRSRIGMAIPTPRLNLAQCQAFVRRERDLIRPIAGRVKLEG